MRIVKATRTPIGLHLEVEHLGQKHTFDWGPASPSQSFAQMVQSALRETALLVKDREAQAESHLPIEGRELLPDGSTTPP